LIASQAQPGAATGRGARARLLGPLLLAVFMRALPLTMLGPLLPAIGRSLGAGLAEVGWIVATYATGSLVAQPVMGRLSDVRGRRHVMLLCIGLFGVGSLLCATSSTLWLLVVGRIVQALGAGGIQPVATAIIGDCVPEAERGSALGSLYAMFGLGTMAGALIGGTLVDGGIWLAAHAALPEPLRSGLSSYPWHLAFWVNVLLAVLAFAGALGLTRDVPEAVPARGRFDILGIALVGGFTIFIMIAATGSPAEVAISLGAAAACVAGLALWERRAPAPLFDPLLFAQGDTAAIYAIALLFGIPSFSLTIYSATYLIARFGATEAQSGLALFGLAVLYVAGAIAGGRAVRRYGARAPLAAGLVLSGVALAFLAWVGAEPAVVCAMAIGGLGLGLVSAPPNALILERVAPARSGAATGLATMLATSGSITAPAAVSAFLHFGSGQPAPEMQAEFLACACLGALCAAMVGLIPRKAESADA
jgi:MFS family permease